mmetsp:Transcript_65512/g.183175  ORF Transcript_65512/g.183175 Transcript_65512/m.183175 type:complete len:313 (+) Transcript_65512:288-1226(+)
MEDMGELSDPEDPAQVRFSRLRERYKIAIEEPAHREVEEYQGVHRRAERPINDADRQMDRPSSGSRPEAVVVLVLRLRHGSRRFLVIDQGQGCELGEVHIPQEVHGMCQPLKDDEVHVEVRREWQCVRKHTEDGKWPLYQGVVELADILADRRCHDNKNELKPEVPALQAQLRPSLCLQSEEQLEDPNDERWQKAHHERQPNRRRNARPERLKRPHVDELSYAGDADAERHVCEVQPDHQRVADRCPASLHGNALHEVRPEDVGGLRGRVDDPLEHVARDEVQPQRDLRIASAVEGDEAAGAVVALGAGLLA